MSTHEWNWTDILALVVVLACVGFLGFLVRDHMSALDGIQTEAEHWHGGPGRVRISERGRYYVRQPGEPLEIAAYRLDGGGREKVGAVELSGGIVAGTLPQADLYEVRSAESGALLDVIVVQGGER